MSIRAETLQKIHRLHQQTSELRDRLARGPKQIKSRETHLAQQQAELEAVKEKLQRTRLTVSQKELNLKERENHILDIRSKLNSCSTNKEYQALIEQIAADEQANSVLSDEILELLDKVEADRELVNSAETAVREAQQQLADVTKKVEAAKSIVENDLARAEKDLKDCEAQLPEDVRLEYQRVVRAHGEDALAPLESEDVCGGCYQRVTPQMINELKLSQLVFCKSCGRLLYVPEDTSVK